MNRRSAVLAMLALPLGSRFAPAPLATRRIQESWTPLFNGSDLAAWDTWLGKPVGLNSDPAGVFSVVRLTDGPAIRISGEIFGALTTREEYGNYHLRFEFKWGDKRWPPREGAVRDSGCCYHSVGPHGASYGFWMRSFEFQIQEGDCGDFYGLAGVIVDCEAVRRNPDDPGSEMIYKKGAPKIVGHTKRIIKDRDHERPRGEWNIMELFCVGQTSVHVVNGKATMILTGLRHSVDDREVALTHGRIQFQSEGAEVFYRNIAVRPIREIPAAILG
jgi:hypothetical protein